MGDFYRRNTGLFDIAFLKKLFHRREGIKEDKVCPGTMSSFSSKVSLIMAIKGGGYILNKEKYFLSQWIIVYCDHLLTAINSDSNSFLMTQAHRLQVSLN